MAEPRTEDSEAYRLEVEVCQQARVMETWFGLALLYVELSLQLLGAFTLFGLRYLQYRKGAKTSRTVVGQAPVTYTRHTAPQVQSACRGC